MPPPFDLALLRTFVTVIDCAGFSRAAERLGLTQSAISLQIRRLEAVAGARLVARRKGHLLGPTEAGEKLLAYARPMLRLAEDAYRALRAPELEGVVRLGLPEEVASRHLPLLAARFAHRHPRLRLEVVCALSGRLRRLVREGALDMALVKRLVADGDGVPIRRQSLRWIGSAGDPVRDLDPLPLALFPEGCVYRAVATAALGRQGRRWRVAYEGPSLSGIQAATLGGLAVAPLPEDAVQPGHAVLDGTDGLPPLPEIELAIEFPPNGAGTAAGHLAETLAEDLAAPRRPQASSR